MSNLIAWIIRAIPFGTIIMFGSMGEITTEKSGNLNLGVPGIMYLGGFAGFASSYFYEKNSADPKGWICVILALVAAIAASMLGGLIFSFLTITLRANQNVTGLALTTFGMGVANFFGVFILNGASYTAAPLAYASFSKKIPFLSSKLGIVSKTVFAYGFLVYAAIIIALLVAFFLKKTRGGLHLRAVGENPATADAAGISVSKSKYLATSVGSIIAGLGGLFYVMDYANGVWSNEGFGDRGWLAIALVIFAIWKPDIGILGSILFGGLYIVYLFIPGLKMSTQELFKMLPYIVTIIVLIIVSVRKKREDQPPASLGLSYFREDR